MGGGQMAEKTEKEKAFEKILRSKKAKKIKADLIDQLEKSGFDNEFNLDLLDDYMDMYATKQLLVEDIKERGVRVEYDNGGGQKGYKKNDSIEQRLKVNAQMLKLLNELHLTPSDMEGGDPDEEL